MLLSTTPTIYPTLEIHRQIRSVPLFDHYMGLRPVRLNLAFIVPTMVLLELGSLVQLLSR